MCFRCHQDTVSGASDTAINTFSFHVNGARDVKLSNGGTYGSWVCTNSYCHSSGQSATAPIQYYNPQLEFGDPVGQRLQSLSRAARGQCVRPVAGNRTTRMPGRRGQGEHHAST